ncbi:MAG: tetratricopeptide repeat protein [Pseudomonadota bacterium]|nr:tetratricopeptide repeat protein [Pseudomonadota bacterium]
MNHLCSDEDLQELMTSMQSDDAGELRRADALLASYPDDPRLHFLRGSILASIGRPIEAMPALKRAVELAPDFAIARFQLGFFELTSGEAANALSTWGPLALLPEGHYLRSFVAGLTHLIRDEFNEAVEQLRKGIAANAENPPLNRDMQLIVDQIGALLAADQAAPQEQEPASAASFLLHQFSDRGSRH